jgi:DNA-binding transcriptional MerR regulator
MAAESASAQRLMRIGEVAELTGTTARTIRYYEEIGLLGSAPDRQQGKHRSYTEADVERFREIVRLRDLLGLSLDQLCQLVEAETARAEIRRELGETDDPGRRRELLSQARVHIETQLGLVRDRLGELNDLHEQLVTKQRLVAQKIDELGHEIDNLARNRASRSS